MKNILTLLLISSLIISCTLESDDPSTAEKTVTIPLAPTELTIQLYGSNEVLLFWKDNSTNEEGFKIERKSGDGVYKQIGMAAPEVTSFPNVGLITDSTYTYKVTAYNAAGNSSTYSNEVQITIYPAVTIGSLTWMPQNLDVDHYRNGDPIPQVTDPTEWANLTTGAWCYYKNITANGVVYGKLYNWYAVNDPRGLAPNGWHVATNAEWITLTNFLGGETLAGGPMKLTTRWSSPNTGATNSSGFSAIGGGARTDDGSFSFQGTLGLWWTADNDAGDVSFYHVLYNNSAASETYHNFNKYGLAVRCVRD